MGTLQASLAVVVSLAGMVLGLPCPGAGAAEAGAPQDTLHQVLPGDDLHLLAGYYYGDARQWEQIWQANRDQVSNPNRIRRGALLRIPDATPPAEPYADFVARTRREQPSATTPSTGKGSPGSEAGPAGPPGGPAPVSPVPGRSAQPAPAGRP